MHSRHFVTIDCGGERRQMHCLRTGSGSPLIALHASPLSARFLLPLMEALSPQMTVIAPDTPGYGLSQPLARPTENLDGYVEALAAFLDALGLEKAAFYGTATGAQIAIEFARTHSQRVNFVILDNAASFSDEERTVILADYFPGLRPREDGSHLAAAWTMARDMYAYFPWNDRRQEARLPGDLPPVSAVQAVARATLEAGPDYARAYRAAFMNEDARRVQALEVPVTVIRWEGSILKRYADRFDALDWPQNIRMLHCGPSAEERVAALQQALTDYDAQGDTPPLPTQAAPAPDTVRHICLPAAEHSLHLLETGGGGGAPLLVLHDLGQSAALALAGTDLGLEERIIAFAELPGHGASEGAVLPPQPGPEDYARVLAAALEGWRPDEKFELLGKGCGGIIAAALAQLMPERMQGLCLEGVPTGDEDFEARKLPDLASRFDGGHWLAAWHEVCKSQQQDAAQTNIDLAQHKTLALMASASIYEASLARFRDYSLEEALAGLSLPIVRC